MDKYYIWLVLALGEGEPEISQLIKRFGTAERAYRAFKDNIALAGRELTSRAEETSLEKADELLKKITAEGLTVITWESADYPEHLRRLENPPCVLFAKGDIKLLGNKLVTVVGSRDMTEETAAAIPKIVERSLRRYTIVGTLSEGCDQFICMNALSAGIPFIEIMPCGFSQTYPTGSRTLRRFLLSSGGLILSEFLPKTKASQGAFLRRSRILGGISRVTLAAQAGENSGALATAEYSSAPLFLPPSNIFNKAYAGAVTSVRNGAKLYLNEKSIQKAFERADKTDAENMLMKKAQFRKSPRSDTGTKKPETPDETTVTSPEAGQLSAPVSAAINVPEPESAVKTPVTSAAAKTIKREDLESDEQFTVCEYIASAGHPVGLEELISGTGLSAGELSEILLDLEIADVLVSEGNRYRRKI